MANGSRNLRYYVSYAWADEGDPSREAQVDALCEQAKNRGIEIVRDKDALKAGGRISEFIRRIGGGDRVFVFLSKKYLTSTFCINELFQMWKNSREDPDDFLMRVRLFTLDDARFSQPEDRFKYAQYWQGKHDRLAELIRESPNLISAADFNSFRLMDEFATRIGDILALFSDTVRSRSFQEFLKYGFDDQVQPPSPSPPPPPPLSPPLWGRLAAAFLGVLVLGTGWFVWTRQLHPENTVNASPGGGGDSGAGLTFGAAYSGSQSSNCSGKDAFAVARGVGHNVDGAIVFSTEGLEVDANGAPNSYLLDRNGLSPTCDGVVAVVNGREVDPQTNGWLQMCESAWAHAQ
jgi:internalin A